MQEWDRIAQRSRKPDKFRDALKIALAALKEINASELPEDEWTEPLQMVWEISEAALAAIEKIFGGEK